VKTGAFAVMVAVPVDENSGLEKSSVITMPDINSPHALLPKPELEQYLVKKEAPMLAIPKGRYLHCVERVSAGDEISLPTIDRILDVDPFLLTIERLFQDDAHFSDIASASKKIMPPLPSIESVFEDDEISLSTDTPEVVRTTVQLRDD
jgi:hypothetical protein